MAVVEVLESSAVAALEIQCIVAAEEVDRSRWVELQCRLAADFVARTTVARTEEHLGERCCHRLNKKLN